VLRWGLVRFWAKDIKVGFSNINAKAETVDTKPAFREAFTRRRCIGRETGAAAHGPLSGAPRRCPQCSVEG